MKERLYSRTSFERPSIFFIEIWPKKVIWSFSEVKRNIWWWPSKGVLIYIRLNSLNGIKTEALGFVCTNIKRIGFMIGGETFDFNCNSFPFKTLKSNAEFHFTLGGNMKIQILLYDYEFAFCWRKLTFTTDSLIYSLYYIPCILCCRNHKQQQQDNNLLLFSTSSRKRN